MRDPRVRRVRSTPDRSRRWTAREPSCSKQLDRPALRPLPADPLRVRDLAQGQGQHRLPRRARPALLLRALSARRQGRRAALHARSPSRCSSSRERVASHLRSFVRGGFSTDPAHMPESHRRHAHGRRSRIVAWAKTTGPRPRRSSRRSWPRAPSRAGLPLRARDHPPRRPLRHRAHRGRVCPGARTCALLLSQSVASILSTTSTRQPLPDARPTSPIPSTATSAAPTYYR